MCASSHFSVCLFVCRLTIGPILIFDSCMCAHTVYFIVLILFSSILTQRMLASINTLFACLNIYDDRISSLGADMCDKYDKNIAVSARGARKLRLPLIVQHTHMRLSGLYVNIEHDDSRSAFTSVCRSCICDFFNHFRWSRRGDWGTPARMSLQCARFSHVHVNHCNVLISVTDMIFRSIVPN